jgi:hypothetical protein
MDVSCLLGCALVLTLEAVFFWAIPFTKALDPRFPHWVIGSNGKEYLISFLFTVVLAMLFLKQPTAFLGVGDACERGSRRLRCAVLLVLQGIAFLAVWACSTSPAFGPLRGTMLDPHWPVLRFLWQFAADAAILSAVLAVSTVSKSGARRVVSFATVMTLGWLAAGVITMIQPYVVSFVSGATVVAVGNILPFFFDKVICETDSIRPLIGTESYAAYLGHACSGIQSMSLMFACSCLFLLAARSRLRFPRALLLLPAGLAVMWASNVFRIFVLTWVGSRISAELAGELFHTSTGWVLFDSLAVGLMVLFVRAPYFSRNPQEEPWVDTETLRYLLPLLMTMFLRFLVPKGPSFWSGPEVPLAMVLTVGATIWLCFRGRGRELFHMPSGRALAIGVVVAAAWIVGIGTGSVVFNGSITEHLVSMSPAQRLVWFLSRGAWTVLAAPLTEELAFRGYLARWLVRSDFQSIPVSRYTAISFLASAVAFGAMHKHWLAATFAGMFFSLSAMQRGKLSDAIASHMVANAFLVAFALATGCWAVWLN